MGASESSHSPKVQEFQEALEHCLNHDQFEAPMTLPDISPMANLRNPNFDKKFVKTLMAKTTCWPKGIDSRPVFST